MTSRRIASAVALTVVASLGLAACGGGSDGDQPEPKGEGPGPVEQPTEATTVTFFSWLGNTPEWKKLADEFHAEYPNITIKFENVPAEQASQVLSTRIAGNNAPDVAYVNASDVADYASRGAAVDLVNYVDRSEVVKPDDYVDAFGSSSPTRTRCGACPWAVRPPGSSTGPTGSRRPASRRRRRPGRSSRTRPPP